MNRRLSVALAGLVIAVPTLASEVTYEIQGVFDDGGTFSGTFEYDPTANEYVNSSNPLGQFDVTVAGGTSGIPTREYVYFQANRSGADDPGSTPTAFVINWGADVGFDIYDTLVFDWTDALNGPDGSLKQPLTGGSETFEPACYPGYCVPTLERQVVSGFVEPVPLPPAAWLLLSALGGIGLTSRTRLVTKLTNR